ncbi:MAG: preprotein translocase subunit SecG [Dissulfurimicrobium sp.]|uniref:preprotein translocase subunit SecG n=1 Tax=Dissulfurimicrobium TaxID=1769732 RepID=UPI001EDAEFF0|nr:preprotein translocase subunit SecG [Dissulfurimicrobium hydrothermale]UKL13503.1 preprotein translocase subunit SecG [Dissulfurimicrobium hydrothermale]
MFAFIVVIHVIVCALLVITVLLQQGKGAEMGAVFGSSEAVFGSAGPASFLSKFTTALAVAFMLTSLGLTYMSSRRGAESVMQNVKITQPASPAAPETSTTKTTGGNKTAPAGVPGAKTKK